MYNNHRIKLLGDRNTDLFFFAGGVRVKIETDGGDNNRRPKKNQRALRVNKIRTC